MPSGNGTSIWIALTTLPASREREEYMNYYDSHPPKSGENGEQRDTPTPSAALPLKPERETGGKAAACLQALL